MFQLKTALALIYKLTCSKANNTIQSSYKTDEIYQHASKKKNKKLVAH